MILKCERKNIYNQKIRYPSFSFYCTKMVILCITVLSLTRTKRMPPIFPFYEFKREFKKNLKTIERSSNGILDKRMINETIFLKNTPELSPPNGQATKDKRIDINNPSMELRRDTIEHIASTARNDTKGFMTSSLSLSPLTLSRQDLAHHEPINQRHEIDSQKKKKRKTRVAIIDLFVFGQFSLFLVCRVNLRLVGFAPSPCVTRV